ncbi:MAG: tetratricopeptide repeat protein [Elusimicrobiota bacterium]
MKRTAGVLLALVLAAWILLKPAPRRGPDAPPPRAIPAGSPPANSSDARLHYERGKALVGKNDCEPAVKELDEAIRLDPTLAPAYYDRGLAKQCLGRNEEGALDYGRAIELDPKDPYAHYARGLYYAGEGRLADARSDADALFSLSSAELAHNLALVIREHDPSTGAVQVEKEPDQ